MSKDPIIVCACVDAAAFQTALEDATDSAALLGSMAGQQLDDGSCSGCYPPVELSATSPPETEALSASNKVATIGRRPARQRLDFSDIDPRALRRGIQTLQLVLEAIVSERPVVIRLPDQKDAQRHLEVTHKAHG